MTRPDSGYSPEDSDDHPEAHEHDAWDTEAEVTCPCCGEDVTVGLDPGGGPSQAYVEDCPVCCQPWQLQVNFDDQGVARVRVEAA